MLLKLLQWTGFVLVHVPDPLLRALCRLAGALGRRLAPARWRTTRANLHHAFPQLSPAELDATARENFARLVEMGLFAFAFPAMGEKELRRRFHCPAEDLARWNALPAGGRLLLTPHSTLMEALTALPLLLPGTHGLGVMFRPLRSEAINAHMRRTREGHGMELLSRRTGLRELVRRLRGGCSVALLFDQNAGLPGYLTTFFGPLCLTTDLPGLLCKHASGVAPVVVWMERTGFWRGRVRIAPLEAPAREGELAVRLNRWLEETLASTADRRADWLWSHRRWNLRDFGPLESPLPHRRNALGLEAELYGRNEPARRFTVIAHLPQEPEACREAAAFLPVMRASRPDICLIALVPESVAGGLRGGVDADEIFVRPAREAERKRLWRKLNARYAQASLLFDTDRESLREAHAVEATKRYAPVTGEEKLPGIRHLWRRPAELERQSRALLWRRWLESLGLPAQDSSSD